MTSKNQIRYIKIVGVEGQEEKTFCVKNGRIEEPRQRQRERNVQQLIQHGNQGAPLEWKWRGNDSNKAVTTSVDISNNSVEYESRDDCCCAFEPGENFGFDDVLNLGLYFAL